MVGFSVFARECRQFCWAAASSPGAGFLLLCLLPPLASVFFAQFTIVFQSAFCHTIQALRSLMTIWSWDHLDDHNLFIASPSLSCAVRPCVLVWRYAWQVSASQAGEPFIPAGELLAFLQNWQGFAESVL